VKARPFTIVFQLLVKIALQPWMISKLNKKLIMRKGLSAQKFYKLGLMSFVEKIAY